MKWVHEACPRARFLERLFPRAPGRPVAVAFATAMALGLATMPAHAFDLQGHRGARGLAPENTIAAFERALEVVREKEAQELARTIREFPEHGIRILAVETRFDSIGVDTPEDLERVRRLVAATARVQENG